MKIALYSFLVTAVSILLVSCNSGKSNEGTTDNQASVKNGHQQYTVCYAVTIPELRDSVNNMLNEGYLISGGIAIANVPTEEGSTSSPLIFYQSLYLPAK